MEYIEVYPLQITQTMSESNSYIMLLDAPSRNSQVPVLIGEAEAQAVIMAVEQRQARRPLTHNLMNNIMEEFMLTLQQVTIDRFEEGIFYSTLYISDGFSEKRIDSRTSDAIVLAMMQQAPVRIASTVLEETCMEPGALIDNLPASKRDHTLSSPTIEELEEMLRDCEEREDYEQAQQILDRIEKMKKNHLQ